MVGPTITLYDLTGVSSAQDLAASWPVDRVRWEHGDYDTTSAVALIEHLHDVLVFDAVTTAVAPDGDGAAVSVTASVQVNLLGAPAGVLGAVHRHLSDLTMRLVSTDGTRPAQLTWTRYADGTSDLAVLGLPVRVELPVDMLCSHDTATYEVAFDPTQPDSLGIHLEPATGGPAVLTFFAALRVTREGKVLIDPTVPLSIGRCVFMYLPARAVHDIAFVPDPVLPVLQTRELPTGWAQKDAQDTLAARVVSGGGMITVRTIDLDRDDPSVQQVYTTLATNVNPVHPPLEVPIEDVALAFDAEGGFPVPAFPVFGKTGIRRAVDDDTSNAEPFDFGLAPIIAKLTHVPWASDEVLFMHVHRCLIGWTQDPTISFDIAVTRESSAATAGAVTVNLTQDWTVLLGYAWGTPVGFKVGNAQMSLLAARVGVNLKKLVNAGTDPRWKFWKWLDALVDVGLVSHDDGSGQKVAFRTQGGGNLDFVLRDVGWKNGAPSASIWVPDGITMSVLGASHFRIYEIGFATTTHGADYLKLSAGYEVGGSASGPPDSPQHPLGNGIWIRGLRIRVQQPDELDAPALAIDGIIVSINASDGSDVEGGGWLRDDVVNGTRVRELGFGIRVSKPEGGSEFVFAGLLVDGTATTAGSDPLDYLLVGVTLGPIPLGSFSLQKASILVARNYVPHLPAPSGVEQNLRLFHWYRSQPTALELPPDRVLGAWEPHPDSWAVGVGLRLGLGNWAIVKLDAFALWLRTPEDQELLVGVELRYKTRPDPIAWLAVDYDDTSGRWGASGGVSLTVKDVLDDDHLPDFAKVSGTVLAANHPRTIAFGHIEDVDSWLQFSIQYDTFNLLLRIGLCVYDYAGDPPVSSVGFVVTGRGHVKVSVFELSAMIEVSVLLGSFSSDGTGAGILASIKAEIAVRVWHLRLGVRAMLALQQIRPYPDAGTLTADLSIETPWWLPDIHFSHTWTLGGDDPRIQAAPITALPVRGAQALGLANATATDLAAPVPAGAGDPARPFSLDDLAQLTPAAPDAAVFDALTPVPVDSVIAIDFAATMTDQLGTGETTPMAASRQANGQLWCDYAVVQIGIRRRPRYGDDAGVWSTLVAPASTSTAAVDPVTQTVDELVAQFTSDVSMRWDRDLVRAGKLDARRLLLNAATSFTLTTANPIADEALLDDRSATCCGKPTPVPFVHLDLASVPSGIRLEPVSSFPGDAARVRWHGELPPVITEVNTVRCARLPLSGVSGTTLATASFDQPAARVLANVEWSAPGAAVVRFELHRGLDVMAVHDVTLDTTLAATVDLRNGTGADQLVVRVVGLAAPGVLYLSALAYATRDALTGWLVGAAHCKNGGTQASGTLAWLPNTDYEVAVTCQSTVGHDTIGSAAVPVSQTALFRTKGWPGLNAPTTPGGDLAPFVEATYPSRPSQLLYRAEPILLVMNERFAPLAPAVDAPATAPPERRQLLEWSMLVDVVGSGDVGTVETISSPDWITNHRQHPPVTSGPRADVVASRVRRATSLDPRMTRLDGVRRSPANCQPHDPTLHDSRIYQCDPPPEGWAHGPYRARIVQRGGPYTMRTSFVDEDLPALTPFADGGPAASWTVDGGSLVAPSGAARAWAVLGEADWNHMQLTAQIDPAGAAAGLALAVSAGQADALLAVVDAAAGVLRLEHRRGGGIHELLFQAPLPGATAPFTLELLGYDDEIVARVGQVELRAARGDLREGRVALVGGPGARFAQLIVEPVEALALDLATSRWPTFEDHVAAHADRAPLALSATGTDVDTWLASAWEDIAATMATDADPRRRSTVFRTALETLGIASVEDPIDPGLSRLLADGASVALLFEGPEPLAFSRDVRITLQELHAHPHPPPHPQPPPVVLHDQPLVHPPVGPLPPVDPFPGGLTWADVETLVLTDDTERRALVVPVDGATRTLRHLTGAPLQLRFDLDRERYRSADPDPLSRTTASVTRAVA